MERLDGILARVLADVRARMSRNEKDAAFARQSGRKVAGDETDALQRPVAWPAEITRPAQRDKRPKTMRAASSPHRIVPQD